MLVNRMQNIRVRFHLASELPFKIYASGWYFHSDYLGKVTRIEQRKVTRIEPKKVTRIEQRKVTRIEQQKVTRIEQRKVTRIEIIRASLSLQMQAIWELQKAFFFVSFFLPDLFCVCVCGSFAVLAGKSTWIQYQKVTRIEQQKVTRIEQHKVTRIEIIRASLSL